MFWFVSLGFADAVSFAPEQAISQSLTNTQSVVVADINNDTFPDIIVGNWGTSGVRIFKNNGFGSFSQLNLPQLWVNAPWTPFVADVNNDGLPDIIASDYNSSAFFQGSLVWFENLGNDEFSTKNVIASQRGQAGWMAAADFNNDGLVDVASTWFFVSDSGEQTLTVLYI